MALDINFVDELIYITSPQTEVTVQELIDEIRDREDDWEGMQYPKIANASGKELLGTGVQVGITLELLDNWQLSWWAGAYTATISGGNLVGGPGGDPIKYTAGVQVVLIQSANATLVTGDGGTAPTVNQIANGVWDDDVSGRVVVNSAATALKASTYEGKITLDTVGGTAGTGWPIGTHFKPSSNLTDALLIMFYGNVDKLILESSVTITASHDISGKVIQTDGIMGTVVTFEAGARSDKAALRYVNVQGEIYSGDEMLIESCSVLTLDNFKGVMNNVAFGQGAEVSFAEWATVIQGTAGGEPTNEVEFSIGTAAVNISNWTGPLKLTNKTGSNRTAVNCTSGCIIIDSSCVAGTIQLLGVGHIESDNSGPGCQVDTDSFVSIESISNHVWEHTDAVLLKDIEGGRWRILNNQMIFYKDDNSTEVARFNLFDSDGNPSEANVYERQRV